MNDVAAVVDYKLLTAVGTGVAAPFIVAIGVLWRRIDAANTKCIEDRDSQNRERIAENKEWFARVEALHKAHADDSQRMFAQIVVLIEKGKDTEYSTINSLTETGRAVTSVKEALNSLIEKIDDLRRDTSLFYDRQSRENPSPARG